MLRALEQVKYVGEIGLDGTPRNKATLPIQTDAFCRIIRDCGKDRTHVMSIHSRAAVSQVLNILEKRNTSASFDLDILFFKVNIDTEFLQFTHGIQES